MIVELNIKEDTLGFVFENILNQHDVDEVQNAIKLRLVKYKFINLYLEEDEVDEIKMGAFWDQVFFDFTHASKIKKIAIVSNRKWIRGVSKLKDLLLSPDVRAFELKDRVDAICWIMK